jgi:O-antigen/teichoic acid export membrane protein
MGVLTLAQIAFLSRHFAYRDLGVVATQLLVTSIATTFCDFGWEGFIIQERGNHRRVALILGSALPRLVGLAVAVDLVAAIAAWLLGKADSGWDVLFFILPVLPLVMLVGALQGFAVKKLEIERLALSEVGGKLLGVAATIGTAWYLNSLNCIVIGFVCTIAFKLVFMASFQRSTLKTILASCTRRARSNKLYYYMATQLTGQVFNILGSKADELIVASTMSLEIFGIYASLKQLVIQGASFAAPLIRRLTMPYFSRDRLSDGAKSDHTVSIFVWSNAAYICFFLTLATSAGLVTQFVLGQKFLPHIDLLIRFSVLWSLQTFAGSTFSAYFQSTGAPFKALAWMSIQVLVQLVVMRTAIWLGLDLMLLCASLSYASMAFIYHIWFFKTEARLSVAYICRRILWPVVFYYLLAGAIIAGTRTLALPYVFEVFASGIFVAIVVLFSVRFHLAQPSLRKNISL